MLRACDLPSPAQHACTRTHTRTRTHTFNIHMRARAYDTHARTAAHATVAARRRHPSCAHTSTAPVHAVAQPTPKHAAAQGHTNEPAACRVQGSPGRAEVVWSHRGLVQCVGACTKMACWGSRVGARRVGGGIGACKAQGQPLTGACARGVSVQGLGGHARPHRARGRGCVKPKRAHWAAVPYSMPSPPPAGRQGRAIWGLVRQGHRRAQHLPAADC